MRARAGKSRTFLVLVLMMHIRHVGMPVLHAPVTVSVCVGPAWRIIWPMLVLVMSIMAVRMRMLTGFVKVFVLMVLGQV